MMDEVITQSEIADALKRSGYLIESRLIKILSDHDYYTYPNETYPDPSTNKSREIDLFAHSYRTVKNLFLNRHLLIDVTHDLIIECANNPQPAVFFKRTEKKKLSIFGRYRYKKIEQEINEDSGADHEFLNFTVGSKDFHYNKAERCSQYCSFTSKKNSGGGSKKEWLASHPDALHDTFNKIYDFIKSREPSAEDWVNTYRKYETFIVMTYPLIVLQGDIYEAHEEKGELKLQKVNHVIFEFNKYENELSSSLLIDVINETYFEEYLSLLKTDMQKLKNIYVKYYKGSTLKDIRPRLDISNSD